eukprot:610872-Amphidinium_carterae.1
MWRKSATAARRAALLRSCRAHYWESGVLQLHGLLSNGLLVDKQSWTAVANACKKRSAWQLGLSVLSSMQASRAQLDVVAFEVLLGLWLSSKHWEMALSQLCSGGRPEMDGFHDFGGRSSFNMLASGLCRESLWEKAVDLSLKLAVFRLAPDSVTYATLAYGSSKAQAWQNALVLFDTALVLSMQLDVSALVGQLRALVDMTSWSGSVALLMRMQHQRICLDWDTGQALVKLAASSLAWQAAVTMLKASAPGDMLGTSAAQLHSEVLMRSFEAGAAWQQACALWDKDIQHSQGAVKSFVGCLGGASYWKHALALLELRQADLHTWNSAMSAAERGSSWVCCMALLSGMHASRVLGDAVSFMLAISAAAKCAQWLQSMRLLMSLQHASMNPTAEILTAVWSAHARRDGPLPRWQMVLHMMAVWGQQDTFDVAATSTGVEACALAEQWALAIAVLSEYEADIASRLQVVFACERALQHQRSAEVLRGTVSQLCSASAPASST